MPTVYTEGLYPFGFLVGPRDSRSIEDIVLASGQNLGAGALLARTFVGTAAGANAAGNTGNPTIGAITVGAKAEAGEYLIQFTAATTFYVYAPNGAYIGSGTTGSAFGSGTQRLTFTLTAGATPAVAGDVFVIMVTEGASTYKAATGSDAVAILGVDTDASGGAISTQAVTRLAEVNDGEINYNGMDAAHKAAAIAALARRNILVRSTI